MTLTISFHPAAEADMDDIDDYSTATWGSDQTRAYLLEIIEAVEKLAERPGIGVDYSFVRPNLRKFNAGSHKILYEYDDMTVHVVRILHERVDVDGKLG